MTTEAENQEFKVRGHPNLVKRAGVVSNVDKESFRRYMAQREKAQTDAARVETLEQQLAALQQQVAALLEANKDDGK